jgi:hypothetical protein
MPASSHFVKKPPFPAHLQYYHRPQPSANKPAAITRHHQRRSIPIWLRFTVASVGSILLLVIAIGLFIEMRS